MPTLDSSHELALGGAAEVASKAALYRQIWNKEKFHKAGEGVFGTEHGFYVGSLERCQVIPEVLPSTENLQNSSGDVSDEPNPTDSGPATARFDRLADLISIKHIRKIYPGA